MDRKVALSAAGLALGVFALTACGSAAPAAHHHAQATTHTAATPAAADPSTGCNQARKLIGMDTKMLRIAQNKPFTDEMIAASALRAAARVTIPAGRVRQDLLTIADDVENMDPSQLQADLSGLEDTCAWD